MWLVNSVKGFLGYDQLQVESGGNNEEAVQTGPTEEKQSLWKQLSSFIGKDVTSLISLPVWIFEPLSFLQIMCEPMQNADLLFKAAESTDSAERMAYLIAFIAAGYSYATRNKKPFNPILGETFEFIPNDKKWKFFAEQVSHHPPIGISEATCEEFALNLEMGLKTAFRGNSSEVFVSGTNHFTLLKWGEHFSWQHLQSCAHNVIIGTMWVDHFGTLKVVNDKTKEVGTITFTQAGYFGSGRWELSGDIVDANGKVRMKVSGKWNGQIFCQKVGEDGSIGEPKLLWTKEKVPNPPKKWNFPSDFTENLNAMDEEYKKILPPNDSRLRSDRYWLERGDQDLAGKEKHRLEEKQRAERKEREKTGETWKPVYFQKVEEPNTLWKERWTTIRDYWKDREQRIQQINNDPKGKTEIEIPASPSTNTSKPPEPEIPIEKLTLQDVKNAN